MNAEVSFGHWLEKRRNAVNLTREELAKKVGCSISALRKIEADLLHTLVRLFSAAHETLDWKCQNQTARPVKYILIYSLIVS
jgi:transcriptional regulator with XRE-family HTH domain